MTEVVASLIQEHSQLRQALDTCRQKTGTALAEELGKLRPLVESHLQAKDRLYAAIAEAAARKSDAANGAVARIFENNMKVLSSGVRGFFEQLEGMRRDPSALEQRFRTVAEVLRSRLETEEKAVFPIHERLHAQPQERA